MARWYLAGSTIERELDDLRHSLTDEEPTEVLMVVEDSRPIGWCQWYWCRDYPDHADGVGAQGDDVGIDYAIGARARIGQGVGTALIATLIDHIRALHPHAGVIADPEATNIASRRVLEKNGFRPLDERVLASEPSNAPMATYRLPAVRLPDH